MACVEGWMLEGMQQARMKTGIGIERSSNICHASAENGIEMRWRLDARGQEAGEDEGRDRRRKESNFLARRVAQRA